MSTEFIIHPAIGQQRPGAAADFTGGTLFCNCASDKVEVRIEAQTAHNHACGCTKCWKPEGALFAQIAVVSRDKVSVTAHAEKVSDGCSTH